MFSFRLLFTQPRNYCLARLSTPSSADIRSARDHLVADRRPPSRPRRLVGTLLLGAVWFQRGTVGEAFAEMRSLSIAVVIALIALGVLERVSRADIVRRLLGTTSFGRSLTIHDVGTAASKGVPLGGALGTGLRWSIARDASVPTAAFTSMLVAYGVATTFVTWLLPLGVLLIDVTNRPPTGTDLAMLAVCAVVVGGSALFWAVVLRSERITAWLVRLMQRACGRLARLWPSLAPHLADHDVGAWLIEVRASLRGVAGRPIGLLAANDTRPVGRCGDPAGGAPGTRGG